MIMNCGKIENLSMEHDIELWWGWGGVSHLNIVAFVGWSPPPLRRRE